MALIETDASTALIPCPADWPSQATMTGSWQKLKSNVPLPLELETFIEAGDKPVFIGFGSMVSSALKRVTINPLMQNTARDMAVNSKSENGSKMQSMAS